MMDFKGSQYERDIILWGVRWYVAYPISYRQLEEMMQERWVRAVSCPPIWRRVSIRREGQRC
jgi:transposase-like protein